MNPYFGPSGLQNLKNNPENDVNSIPSVSDAFYTAEAWERFAHTGDISDYLHYKHLENHRLEVIARYGGTDKDQWDYSPNSYHGGGGSASYYPYRKRGGPYRLRSGSQKV